ncbi:MAG TPA: hypothetical protein VM884_09410 [Flavisolibacter sp.]|jgi:hypothetical protein|nr:hypothetical protein [Flavisolibacter sp.]
MSPDISEKEIGKLANYHTTDTLIAQSIRKDFKTAPNSQEPYYYPELPPLKIA